MQKLHFKFGGGYSLGYGLALILCLAVSMLSPCLVQARTHHRTTVRHHTVRHSRHVAVHSRQKSHRRLRVRHASVRHTRSAKSHALVRHASLRRTEPAKPPAAHVQEYRKDIALDQQEIHRPMGSYLDVSVPSSMPAALRGSHQVLVHQNIIADVEGLNRIQDNAQLDTMVRSGSLVALPASSGMVIDPRLSSDRRYCRRWTAQFLSDLTRAHERYFSHPLIVTSAVRTVSFQRHLAHYNGNAAPAHGDTASPHLTGQTIDIGKKGMSRHEIAWMRSVLSQLQASGKLDVEEEFHQACFHISVYKTYLPHKEEPTHLVASNNLPSEDLDVSAANATAVEPIAEPIPSTVTTTRSSPRHAHSSVHRTRRVNVHHRRRHHRSMSLLAAGIR